MTKSRDLGNLVKTGAVQFPASLGTEGQTLKVNSAGNALEFADAGGAGMTVYAGMEGTDGTPSGAKYLLNVTSPQEGDQAFVSSTNNIFVRSSSGWRKVATVQESPGAITGASSNYDVTTTTTDITLSSTDPEGFDVTWSYAVGGGGTLSGSNIVDSNNVTLSTISVQTAAANSGGVNTITYRITPVTTSVGGTYTITFSATDTQSTGVAQTSAINFTISFSLWGSYTQTGVSRSGHTSFLSTSALNSDGTKMLVGIPSFGTTGGKIAYYTRSGSTWTHQKDIVSSSGTGYRYGNMFAYPKNNPNLMITSWEQSQNNGGHDIYYRASSGAETRNWNTGYSGVWYAIMDASFSDNGDYLIIMTKEGSNERAYIKSHNTNGHFGTTRHNELCYNNTGKGVCCLSGDGNFAAYSRNWGNNNFRVMYRSGTGTSANWYERTYISEDAQDGSLKMNSDGSKILVCDGSSGFKVYSSSNVSTPSSATWSLLQTVTISGSLSIEHGHISSNGNLISVSEKGTTSGIYVYEWDSNQSAYVSSGTISNPSSTSNEFPRTVSDKRMGWSMSGNGNYIAAGVSPDDTNGYVFNV